MQRMKENKPMKMKPHYLTYLKLFLHFAVAVGEHLDQACHDVVMER